MRLIKPKYSPVLQIVPLTVFTISCINHDNSSQDFSFPTDFYSFLKRMFEHKKTHVLILVYIIHNTFLTHGWRMR